MRCSAPTPACRILLFLCGGLLLAQAPYAPTWESLSKHPAPQWYADAKFGIYFHWGIYSVPAFGTEWYSRNMYQPNRPEYRHHLEKYGPLDRFGYKDFIPMFGAGKFDAAEWAALFEKAGARFAGPVAEHADGFSMWNSKVNPWNAARMGPKRDIVGEMARAVRARNMKFLATLHHQWLWGWYSTPERRADVFDPALAGFYWPSPPGAFNYEHPNPPPSAEFIETWKQKALEIVDGYHPDLIYFDSRMSIIPEAVRTEFLAYYYNQARRWGREVSITYKNQDFARGSGVLDLEQGRMAEITDYVWQNDDTVDWNSWAYLENPNYKPAGRLVHELVDVVSKNGILLLDIGPRPDGTIPDPIRERLLAIGAWLKVNGEAIYGSRPWKAFGEGPTRVAQGSFGESKIKEFTSRDIRFTTRGNTLYAIALGWPGDGELLIRSLARPAGGAANRVSTVSLLGFRGRLKWTQSAEGLAIVLPREKPCDYAFSFRIEGQSLAPAKAGL